LTEKTTVIPNCQLTPIVVVEAMKRFVWCFVLSNAALWETISSVFDLDDPLINLTTDQAKTTYLCKQLIKTVQKSLSVRLLAPVSVYKSNLPKLDW
jgi:hypothetical protein